MAAICDACSSWAKGNVHKVTAKQWKKNVCEQVTGTPDIFFSDDDEWCLNFHCIYNIDGEVCVFFYICDECVSDWKNIDRVYLEHTKLLES
jgi:hypothetical protein